jgi:hypothetical protein
MQKLDGHRVRWAGASGEAVGVFDLMSSTIASGDEDTGVLVREGDLLYHDPLKCAAEVTR